MTLKEKLLDIGLCIDNEYLDKYVELIESNRETKREKFKTQKHHIIPRCYYEKNNIEVDNSRNNLVILKYRDHFIAHLLLALCSSLDEYFYDNFIALSYMNKKFSYTNLDVLQEEYEKCRKRCSLYNPMYDERCKENHRRAMRSESVRGRISATMKRKKQNGELFSKEIRQKISENQKTLIYIYKDNQVIRVQPNVLEKYLQDGWQVYQKRSYAQICGSEMMTTLEEEKQRNRFNTRGVGVYCIVNGDRFDFQTIRDATVWWHNNYKPFGSKYTEITLKRKILESIKGNKITYLPRCDSTKKHQKSDNEKVIIDNIHWYKV